MKNYTLELDRTRELRYNFKAMRRIREKFGDKNIEDLLNMQVDEIPVLIWAGLAWEKDKELTLERVEDLLDEKIPSTYTILQVINIATEAVIAHMGVSKADIAAAEKKMEKLRLKKSQSTSESSSKSQEDQPSSPESEIMKNSSDSSQKS